VLIAPFGAVTGKRMRAIRRESSKDSATVTDLNTRVRDPFMKISFCVRTALFFGIVFLMTVRAGFAESMTVLGVSLLLGFAWAFFSTLGSIAKRDPARIEAD
jgi:ABC-type multidrug transport system fused ATPase/permease subunit